MSALSDLLSGVNQGNQAADTAQQGMRPSGPQPMGSPQMAIKGLGDLQSLIAGLNATAEKFRQSGLPKSNEYVLDMIECTRKLQGIVVGAQKELQALVQSQQPQGMQQQPQQQQQQMPRMQ